jgi:parvulin-like peptidyl-prolyl isomerase
MKLQWLGLITSVTLLAAACGGGSEKQASIEGKLKEGKKLAARGDVEIHEGFVTMLQGINPNISAQLKTPAGKKRLVDNLIEQEILYRASLKRGIPDNPKYREKAALYERVIYAQGLVEEEIDVKAKEYYDQHKEDEFSQVEVSQILIRTQPKRGNNPGVSEAEALKKAQEAEAKLKGGASWKEVVETYSDDRLTKNREGALGKLSRNDRRAERLEWNALLDKAFSMKAGEVSDPIKAKDGYHIIKVTSEATVASYEEVQSSIQFKLRVPVKNEILSGLSKGGEIEYFDEEIKALVAEPELPQGALPPGAHLAAQPEKPAATPAASPTPKVSPKAEEKKTDGY